MKNVDNEGDNIFLNCSNLFFYYFFMPTKGQMSCFASVRVLGGNGLQAHLWFWDVGAALDCFYTRYGGPEWVHGTLPKYLKASKLPPYG